MAASIKTADEINKMRVVGRLTAEVLEMIEPYVQVGVTTGELDRICHDYITRTLKAIPAPLNYHGFPRSICTSLCGDGIVSGNELCDTMMADKTLAALCRDDCLGLRAFCGDGKIDFGKGEICDDGADNGKAGCR